MLDYILNPCSIAIQSLQLIPMAGGSLCLNRFKGITMRRWFKNKRKYVKKQETEMIATTQYQYE